MCIALLLIYGVYCLLKDFFAWLNYKLSTRQPNKPRQEQRTFRKEQQPISMNELLTFEELLEDDE